MSDQATMIHEILDHLEQERRTYGEPACLHCGKRLAVGGSGYLGTNESRYTAEGIRMPCDPRYIDCCHQPFGIPDWERRREPVMRRVCAGTWGFMRELSDGREVFRCRGCDEVLVLVPTFSRAGLAQMRQELIDRGPAYEHRQELIESISEIEAELAGHPSLYEGPRSRRPRL